MQALLTIAKTYKMTVDQDAFYKLPAEMQKRYNPSTNIPVHVCVVLVNYMQSCTSFLSDNMRCFDMVPFGGYFVIFWQSIFFVRCFINYIFF